MSFKDFAATHTGRRFFDGFQQLVDAIEILATQIKGLRDTIDKNVELLTARSEDDER